MSLRWSSDVEPCWCAGNEKPELIAKLAGAGINSVDDVAELSDAKIAELKEAGILTVTGAKTLKRNALRFINIRRG